ncbi:MAG TPA: response regulator transcription factor [Bacillota bacterium]
MKVQQRTILVIDDEPQIVAVVESYLENSGYQVSSAETGRAGLDLFERVQPCLVILDLMLPDIPGEEVCSRIRKKSHVPIIMLTAKVDEEEVLEGLGLGADDYVTKPFSPRQLVARVEALLRRTDRNSIPLANRIAFGDDLVIDGLKHEVRKQGEIINLTPHEYSILMLLAKYPSKTFTREELVEMVLDESYEGYQRTIDAHIKNLRQKIETDPHHPRFIRTVHGIGYRFGGD